MKKLLFFVLICIFALTLRAEPFREHLITHLDALAEEMFQGYNLDNSAIFYQYFADKMKPIKSKEKYEALYKNPYKKELGYI
ncbi:MAG: hypothetical protein GF375_07505, partial [Candidatus Omnitrophica bacterium]|nr:hypothetical protein [Candidatus Omnitrophota bacterium]MBD3269816.1 hypothetical protein [Candidatus Omnitrophota bacterium]